MIKRIICALIILVIMLSVLGMPVLAYTFPFNDIKTTSWQYKPVKRVYISVL